MEPGVTNPVKLLCTCVGDTRWKLVVRGAFQGAALPRTPQSRTQGWRRARRGEFTPSSRERGGAGGGLQAAAPARG